MIRKCHTVKEKEESKIIYTFQFSQDEIETYNNKCYGFMHGTNNVSLAEIITSGELKSSANVRAEQIKKHRHQTGGDRNEIGSHGVYFRYVEKKSNKDLAENIVRAQQGVGSSGGVYLFLPLSEIHKYEILLASGVDRKGKTSFNGNTTVAQAISQFELGLIAARDDVRSNEIGFYGNIPIEDIAIIVLKELKNEYLLGDKYEYKGSKMIFGHSPELQVSETNEERTRGIKHVIGAGGTTKLPELRVSETHEERTRVAKHVIDARIIKPVIRRRRYPK